MAAKQTTKLVPSQTRCRQQAYVHHAGRRGTEENGGGDGVLAATAYLEPLGSSSISLTVEASLDLDL